MKKSALLFSALMGLSFTANAAVEMFSNTVIAAGYWGGSDGTWHGSAPLNGRTLIEGSAGGIAPIHGLDEHVNVSAVALSCQTTVDGQATGNPCSNGDIFSLDYYVSGDELHWQMHTYARWENAAHNANVNGTMMEIRLQISYATDETSIFDSTDRSVNLDMPNTLWADIHYKINDGAQLNYRMTKNGDSFKQVVFQALENYDQIKYSTTSQNASGEVSTSPWTMVLATGLADLLSTNVSGSTLSLSSLSNLEWVDIHYTINGSSQYNYRMSGAAKSFSFTIPQDLISGDVITYSYTYSLNGRATDSVSQLIIK